MAVLETDGPTDPVDEEKQTHLIGGELEGVSAGTGTATTNTYIFDETSPFDGEVRNISLSSASYGLVEISTWDRSGDVFTRSATETHAVASGIQTISTTLPIAQGQHVGFSSSSVMFGAGVGGVPWFAGAFGASTVTDSTTVGGLELSIRFEICSDADVVIDQPVEDILNLLIIGIGQSLWEGSDGVITTTASYGALGFPAYLAGAPTSLSPATVASTERPGRSEHPLLGLAENLKQLSATQAGLGLPSGTKIIISNNAVGSTEISQSGQSSASYQNAISAAKNLNGLTTGGSQVMAVSYGQGESDSILGTDPADYLADLKQLAVDLDTDIREATGQSKQVHLFTYQMNATGRDIGLMQLEAGLTHPLIHCVGPMYQYSYYDTLHINAASSRLVGAQHATAIKDVCCAGLDWEPLRPISSNVLGNDVTLTFNKAGLVLDAVSLPAQIQQGFTMQDSTGSNVPISSVNVLNSNQVRLTCVLSPSSGWVVKYGVSATGRSDAFIGLMGNLRDSAGFSNTFDGFDLHNWCVVFNYSI